MGKMACFQNVHFVEQRQPKTRQVLIGPPRTEQILWPRHCVQRTWGAELHPKLKVKSQSSQDNGNLTKTNTMTKTRQTQKIYAEIQGHKPAAST